MNDLKIYNAIRDLRGFDAVEKGILYHIHGRGECWESIAKIAEYVGTSKATCLRRLAALEEKQLVVFGKIGRVINESLLLLSVQGEPNTTIETVQGEPNRFRVNQNGSQGTETVQGGPPSKDTNIRNQIKKPNKRGSNAHERAREKTPPRTPRDHLETWMRQNGISDLVWPLAFALQEHCTPVQESNLIEKAETLFGYEAAPDEIAGLSNGYWGIYGNGPRPYPSQVATHLHSYRKWVDDGKPMPAAPAAKPKMAEPKSFDAIRKFLNASQEIEV